MDKVVQHCKIGQITNYILVFSNSCIPEYGYLGRVVCGGSSCPPLPRQYLELHNISSSGGAIELSAV